MSSALSWLEAKMSGPAGSAGMGAAVRRQPESQRHDGDHIRRANHMARSPEPVTTMTGREARK